MVLFETIAVCSVASVGNKYHANAFEHCLQKRKWNANRFS